MKVSELIEGLKRMEKAYGDLPVSISLGVDKKIITDGNLTLAYNQIDEGKDEIGIQNFPY